MYAALVGQIESLNHDTARISNIVYGTWDSVGVTNFSMFFGGLRAIGTDSTLDDVKLTYLAAAACCLFPSTYVDDDLEANWNLRNAVDALEKDKEGQQSVLDAVHEFNMIYDSLSESDDALSGAFKEFREKYEEKHKDEIDNLREWILESSMYVEAALEPSGSLIEYGNKLTEYEDSMKKFKKIADSF